MTHSFLVQIDLDEEAMPDVQELATLLLSAMVRAACEQGLNTADAEVTYLGGN